MKTKQEQKEEADKEYWAIRNRAMKVFNAIVDPAEKAFKVRLKEIDEQDEPLEVEKGIIYMAKSGVQFTKDNEYYTPKEFVDRFGQFDYDPATTKEKAEEFGIADYDTIETNGLTKDWTQYKRIWINPPFTIKHEFLSKAWETYQIAGNDIYILFPIEFITTARFHNSVGGGKLFIPNGRINFESGLGKKASSPAFGSVVMKIQDKWEMVLIDKLASLEELEVDKEL